MALSDTKISFGIVGGGWRTEFYLRVAAALPALFEASGIVVRDASKGSELERRFGVATFRSLEEMLELTKPSFVVVSVPWAVCPVIIRQLAERGIPVLSETPPAPDLEGLLALQDCSGVQVAEQYPFQPRHQAIDEIIRSGRLGEVSHVQVSVAHGYHGIALIRRWLGVGFDAAQMTAKRFSSPITAGPNRAGKPQRYEKTVSQQTIAWFEFNGKQAVFDFTGDQYFSWIRSSRILIRGDQGELANDTLRYLADFETPVQLDLKRVSAGENGNLEGQYLKGILCGEQWVYTNPFAPARLTDDELAVAETLQKMSEYVRGGPSFYPLAEASQDHYLNLLLNQAIETGETVTSAVQPWATRT
ncbi:Gfo/Idh/MocA family protein [Paenibacillus thalictri]|uniref:Gfo/Idh/MocA family oxidoreductase n=1 Tax=Paenibacillus thalictri TaxID=2527873 RepID=A0A4Q9DHD3_9BACL|nr:Gfo/Idh/MocA family oxidoreductase [Paenibacillus thalictri]TBL72386.1 Gfo/Idh/MocA family oxidoreductase [Paenibacillus thalictri]